MMSFYPFSMISQEYQVYLIPPFPRQIPVFEWHWSPSQHVSPAPQPEAPSLKHIPPRSSGHLKSEHLLTLSSELLSPRHVEHSWTIPSQKQIPPTIHGVVNDGGLEWSKGLTALSDFSMLAILSTCPPSSPPDFRGPPEIHFFVWLFYVWGRCFSAKENTNKR